MSHGNEEPGPIARPAPEEITRGAMTAAMAVGSAALMVMGMQPVILGGLAGTGRLSAEQLGQVATLEVIALAVGTAIGPRLINQGRMRRLTGLLCVLLALADLLMLLAGSPPEIFAARAVAGLLEGMALASTIVVLTHSRQPDRANGIFLAVQTIPQMVAVYAFPTLIIPMFGLASAFMLLSGLAFLAAASAFWLPDRVAIVPPADAKHFGWSAAGTAALVAILVQSAGIGGAWTYVEMLATQRHLASEAVGIALAGLLGTQILGAFLVAWVGWKLSANLALLVGTIVQATIILWLTGVTHDGSFIIACFAFGLFWLALQPFQLRQIILIDPTRRMALLVVPTTLVGMSLGPLLLSFFVAANNVIPAFKVGGALLGSSALLYAILLLIARSSRGRPGASPTTDDR